MTGLAECMCVISYDAWWVWDPGVETDLGVLSLLCLLGKGDDNLPSAANILRSVSGGNVKTGMHQRRLALAWFGREPIASIRAQAALAG